MPTNVLQPVYHKVRAIRFQGQWFRPPDGVMILGNLAYWKLGNGETLAVRVNLIEAFIAPDDSPDDGGGEELEDTPSLTQALSPLVLDKHTIISPFPELPS